ncbi:hypothetical protein JL2886_00298 [Phaeobacter gallaeciensis]|uniref:DUF924 domain-containing protein n=1 Tax=Phaeobacter gallaeciensis TaxID=60890 RepID=A0A1B0ZM98_9RHOB|nr:MULTISPECIES: DUF924 family protein [Phaeobacter]MEE2634659.1 DUF924 family protein [Pseudomonadota bacterium]ANP35231.1 hypothetical protein JL2886_00298 [Phaeobacter gallaeciensis]MDE4062481.1 DUF924 domain-containing protein [Phaeobacter gallaeciensis]MDE4125461.1 DUF924 domain-containing protein [Phaeobacter gallaeciensis]MDE4129968.1 DUF924 domain-containing protein [Phaeobacter gallaeciensis]
MVGPEEILEFWLDEVGEKGWYVQDDDLDATIRKRFGKAWEEACEGKFSLWLTYPSGTLAYIILMDQFPRNMFRGEGQAFASDEIALAVAKNALNKKWDLKIDEPARQFFYLPLMHSENLCDQERCVRLLKERMPEYGASNLLHARAHRDVIRKFGRFPYRNDALLRHSTEPERDYVEAGGYGATIRTFQQAS